MKIIVIGAGAWGTGLALAASARHSVSLWARDATQAQAMHSARENRSYLPGISLPAALHVCSTPWAALPALAQGQDLAIIATPMAGLREALSALQHNTQPVAWLCKGFEHATGLLGHEVAQQAAPLLRGGALSGPSFALEVAQGHPTALVAASPHASVQEALVTAFHSPSLRVYANADLVGVEVGGAVKNVLAIATGLCDGLQLGLNARAALVTRGLAEMTRLGLALGGQVETFMGLSGLGDLVLTATGALSRNRQVGLLLAQGKSLSEAVASLGHVAEGVLCARTVALRAQSLGVEMPITACVDALLSGRMSASQAVAALMGRDARGEARGEGPAVVAGEA